MQFTEKLSRRLNLVEVLILPKRSEEFVNFLHILHYPLKKWVEKIQTAGYNGSSTVRTAADFKEYVHV